MTLGANRCQLTRPRPPKRSLTPLFRRTAQVVQEHARTQTAFPAMRPLAPERKALTRGRGQPLAAWERQAALNLALREVYAKTSIGPRRSMLCTIMKFLRCLDVPLIPFTTDVVVALGASLTGEDTDRLLCICTTRGRWQKNGERR